MSEREDVNGGRSKRTGVFDKAKFGKWLREKALPPYGKGRCARYVREALEAACVSTAGHPVSAKEYGPLLLRNGFSTVDHEGYREKLGDIVVFQRTSTSPHGHIQGYDGKNWISDFVQRELYPGPAYRLEKPAYVIYRH